MNKPLLVLGSINADLYVEIERLPLPGETLPGQNAAVRPGGKGANQAAAAARLGADTWCIGQVGSDAYAPTMTAALRGNGVRTELLTTVAGETGQAFILLQQGGENSIIIVGGANQRWNGISSPALECIRSAAALLLQREIPESINLAAAQAAHAAGVPVVFDCGGADAPLPADILPLIAVLSPNETELARLTGMPTNSDAEVLRAAKAMQAKGVGTVLVKLGARGSLLVPKTGEPLRQSIFPVSVVDTTGAGDCFTAAYAVAMSEGLPETQRLRFAAAAAAICVTGLGAMPSMPERLAVERLLSV